MDKDMLISFHGAVIRSGILWGLIYSNFRDAEWALNIAIFGIWLIIAIKFMSFAASPEVLFKRKVKFEPLFHCLFFANLAMLIATGWLVTALIYCLLNSLMEQRRKDYLKAEDAKARDTRYKQRITSSDIAHVSQLLTDIAIDLEAGGVDEWESLGDCIEATKNNFEHDCSEHFQLGSEGV